MAKELRLNVRISEYESRQLEEEAKRRGWSVSKLVRSWIATLPPPSTDDYK